MAVRSSASLCSVGLILLLLACGEAEPPGNAPTGGGGSAAGGASAGSSGMGAVSGTTTAGSGGTGGGASGAAGSGGVPACPESTGLQVARLATTAIAAMGKPFDTASDDASPWGWDTNYGKAPEIVALPDGENVDILFQDHSADPGRNEDDPNKNAKQAYVVRVEKTASGYAVTRAYRVQQLAHIMGLARDEGGNYYVATGVDEDADLTPAMPAPGMHRPWIVKLVKFDANGCKSLEIDAGLERQRADADSEPIINPMVAASSRLAYQGGRLALVHGINVDYDPKVSARHQKAMTTHFDAMTGAATLTSSMWVSHSFDQRLFHDATGFVELHLGDAYPRAIALGRFNDGKDKTNTKTFELFRPKGDEGDNNTFTRLGGIAPIASGEFGYLIAFTTDRGTETEEILNGTRDLALLRVRRGFASMDEKGSEFVDGSATQAVSSSGANVTNKLTWLTDYAPESAQADRPRLAAIGDDQFVVLWERWTGADDRGATFGGTFGQVVGSDGLVKVQPRSLGPLHLSRADDVVSLGSQALYVSGDGSKLTLNLIATDLSLSSIDLP